MKKFYLLLLLAFLPLLANADAVEIDGIYYNLNAEGPTAEVTTNPNHYSGEVTIPASITYNATDYSVTSIGVAAFLECSGLTSVTIPNSVTSIGHGAFAGCSGITSITIPNKVTSLGISSFAGSGLTSITIPNSVTSIGNGAFRGCKDLASVTISSNVTSINNETFQICPSLSSITIPNSVTSVGDLAFNGCSSLTSLEIPNGVTSIGFSALSATGLTSVTIPNSVTSISENSFTNCKSLASVSLPSSLTTIGASAFYGCSALTSLFIPKSVTTIGNRAFYGCSGLTSIVVEDGNQNYDSRDNCNALIAKTANILLAGCKNTVIPNSVATIGPGAFYLCSGLTTIMIPNSVTSIEDEGFCGCSGLTSLIIPYSVNSIGYIAFSRCSALESIVVEDGNQNYDSRNNCNALIAGNFLLAGCKNTVIPNDVTAIGAGAFQSCSGLTSISIPNSVTTIYEYSFAGSGLIAVTIPASVASIADGAFSNCNSLSGVYCLAGDVPQTHTDAFNNTTLGNVTLHVPASSVETYRTTAPWSGFGEIVGVPQHSLVYKVDGEVYKSYQICEGASITPEPAPTKDGYVFSGWSTIPATMPANDVTVTGSFVKDGTQKCATPIISVVGGKIKLSCETEAVTFRTTVTYNSDSKDLEDEEIILSSNIVCHISVYATKEGYVNSETATKDVNLRVGTAGDANADGEVTITDAVYIVNLILDNVDAQSRE